MYKLGLKLWSINTDYYYDEAIRLYREGFFDYIELYVVPETIDTINKWKNIEIPFALHAPHFKHGLNFSDSNKRVFNKNLIDQVKKFSDSLNPIYTVFHPGIDGNIDETILQLLEIRDLKFAIENKPYIVPSRINKENRFCIGATIEEINKIIKETKCKFCLDIGHAMCCANYLKENPYQYLNDFNKLNPIAYHLSDNNETSIYDKHLHIGEGGINFDKIKHLIKCDSFVVIETIKNSNTDLNDFMIDIEKLRK